ncbi:MAG: methyltransferase [Bacteroidota bacterium]
MASQQQKVAAFFDRIARRYRQRNNATTQYFSKRLQLALQQLPHPNDSILDIGCGTGLLYDALRQNSLASHYTGIDLSQRMLDHSQIPEQQAYHGSLRSFLDRNTQQFDVIYALGFTTYLSKSDIAQFYQDLQSLAAPNGRIIISYTNRDSLDFRLRELIHGTIGRWLPGDRSLGRNFPIFASDLATVTQRAKQADLYLTSAKWLPAQLPILGWPLPFTSVIWRPDFLVELAPKN